VNLARKWEEDMMDNPVLTDPAPKDIPEPRVSDAAKTDPAAAKRGWAGKLLGPLLLAATFAAGWVLAGGGRQSEKEALPAEDPSGRDSAAVTITVAPVCYRPVQRTIEAVGTLYGFEEVVISARVEGRVSKLHRDVADCVKPGELLLEVDPTDYDLQVEQAERSLHVELAKLGLDEAPSAGVDLDKVPPVMLARTRLENARLRHDRARRLLESRAVSAEEADTAGSDFRAAQAEYANQLLVAKAGLATVKMKQTALAVARQQRTDARVLAPTPTLRVPEGSDVAYVITHRAVAEGTLVRPGTELFKLTINGTLKLRVPVPERHGPEVRLGQSVDVSTAAFPRPTAGTVSRINPAVDPATRTFQVEILVPNAGGELKPGSFAKAAIQTRLDPEAVTVPLSALVQFAGITKVFLVENGRAREFPVTLGVQTPEWVEIATPALPRGALVITSGQTALANDTAVRIKV
jgi:RND family efflux transporter MFP subunit